MRKLSTLVLGLAVAGMLSAQSASAADITNLLRRPVRAINPYVPFLDVSDAVPTTRDILSIPTPRRGSLVRFPTDVLQYGINVSPSARVARQNNLLPFVIE